jgi:hypothetical protein
MHKPKILLLGHSSRIYDGNNIYIERADLTRRMACLETWVPAIESHGHEVIFFQGGCDQLSFSEKYKTLSLPLEVSYDHNPPRVENAYSFMVARLQAAIKWALENREFDYVFRIDDGSYLNQYVLDDIYKELEGYDILYNSCRGGAGIFMSKKVCEDFVQWEDDRVTHIEDGVINRFFHEHQYRINSTNLLCHQYILGEKLFSIHYPNGKRMYFTDYIIKNYYLNGKRGNRKVIIDYPFDITKAFSVNTWDSPTQGITPRWYSYTTDSNFWEFYGKQIGSYDEFRMNNPFGKNSMQKVVVYKTIFDCKKAHERLGLIQFAESVNEEGAFYCFIESKNNIVEEMIKVLIDEGYSVLETVGNITDIVDSKEVQSEEGVILKINK